MLYFYYLILSVKFVNIFIAIYLDTGKNKLCKREKIVNLQDDRQARLIKYHEQSESSLTSTVNYRAVKKDSTISFIRPFIQRIIRTAK